MHGMHYIHTLSYSLDGAERDGVIASNPFTLIRIEEKLKMRKTLPKYLTLEELRLLANAESKVKPEVRAAFLFSCFSGLRWGDMSMLRWSQVKQVTTGDGEGYTAVELQIRKTDTPLTVPLPVQAIKILKEQRDLQKDGKDFAFPRCSDKPEARIRNKEANVMLETWAKDAGLNKRLHFHMARHTFATITLEHGAEPYTVR